MVYDATKSGLNDAVWAPWFAIPNVDCHLRAAEVGTFMADCDVGGMFLNFMLVVEERVRGARLDPENVFRWYKVVLNLPGMRP